MPQSKRHAVKLQAPKATVSFDGGTRISPVDKLVLPMQTTASLSGARESSSRLATATAATTAHSAAAHTRIEVERGTPVISAGVRISGVATRLALADRAGDDGLAGEDVFRQLTAAANAASMSVTKSTSSTTFAIVAPYLASSYSTFA